MRGLPASGKSTLAQEIQKADGNCVRLNKDLLREMLHFDKFTGKNERVTSTVEKSLAIGLLMDGKNVIIDDTNLNPKVFESWVKLANDMGMKWNVYEMNTPVWECVNRDQRRDKSVGRDVIVNMARKYGLYEQIRRDVICDIDGTLCDISDRLHLVKGTDKKDWDAFFANIPNDKPRMDVIRMIQVLSQRFNIVLVSGRPEDYKKETIQWLENNNVPYETLIMRKSGDRRDDTIVKQEILDSYFRKDQIEFVFDDRPRVIRMWRSNGLTTIDVGEGVEF